MIAVRVHPDGPNPAPSREHQFETRGEALAFINSLGKTDLIRRFGRIYSVRPKGKK